MLDIRPAARYDFARPADLAAIRDRDPLFVDLCETPAFRRLQQIRFLGGIEYYLVPHPNGALRNRRFNRYQHSLGVGLLALRYAERRDLPERDRRLAYAAALLHDLGHPPLSHSLEPLFEAELGLDHHKATADLIRGSARLGIDVAATLGRYGVDADAVLAVLDGTFDPFEGFFAGPINFDTIEGICRSRFYMTPGVTTPNPVDVLDSAMDRARPRDADVVDGFWRCKDDAYRLMIRSSLGVVADHLCRELVRSSGYDLRNEDFFLTEPSLMARIPALRVIRDGPSAIMSRVEALDLDGFRYIDRQFYIDSRESFFARNDRSRYRQAKSEKTLVSVEKVVSTLRNARKDWFHGVGDRTGEIIL